jgi:hypothetical protein
MCIEQARNLQKFPTPTPNPGGGEDPMFSDKPMVSRRQRCAHMDCSKQAYDRTNEKDMVMMWRYEQDAAMFSSQYGGDTRQRSTAL